MPYDDIRGSHWDIPDDEDDDGELFSYGIEYDLDPCEFYDECSMCGRERILCDSGRCSHCETVWNS